MAALLALMLTTAAAGTAGTAGNCHEPHGCSAVSQQLLQTAKDLWMTQTATPDTSNGHGTITEQV